VSNLPNREIGDPGHIDDHNTIAQKIATIESALPVAQNADASANAASQSASAAAGSASAASVSASNALNSANQAQVSSNSAAASANAASQYVNTVNSSISALQVDVAAVESSKNAAAASAAAALSSEQAAALSEAAALVSEQNAASSESAADADRIAAQQAASDADADRIAAAASESAAAGSASAALTSQNAAAVSQAAAATSASDALSYQTGAGLAVTAANAALGNANAQVTSPIQSRRYGAEGSVLRNLSMSTHPAEELLKTAVWWIDAAHDSAGYQIVDNLGWGGPELSASVGSTGSPDSNDPLFLDWVGDNYVYLPGVANNFMTVPDELALRITGDIDIRVQVAMDDWTPGAESNLLGKYNAATEQRGYTFSVLTDGKLRLRWSTTGSDFPALDSSAAAGITDGSVKWVRVTLDVDNGASGHDVQFFTSDDGIAWTQLGTTQTGAGVTSIFAATHLLQLSGRDTNQNMAAGKFYRAIVKDGIDGPSVLDVDTSRITSGSDTSFTARTGQVVTINRSTSGRKSVAVTQPCWLFGTDDYMEVADNDLVDFGTSDSFTLLAVHRPWGTQGTNDTLIAKKANTTNTTAGYSLSNGSSTALLGQCQIGDGTNGVTASSAARTVGALAVSSAVRDVAADTVTVYYDATAGLPVTDTTASALANSEALRVGRLSGAGTEYSDFEGIAFAVFRRALTQAEIRIITDFYQGNGYEPVSPAKFTNESQLPVSPSDGTLVFQQDSKELLLRQGNSWNGVVTEASVLRSLPQRPPEGEALLKQAVWWIDAAHNSSSGQTIKNLGWGGSVLDARNGSAAGADSNDALFLDWSGENYVYLPGVAGNNFSVPDEAALDITGDIDIRVRVALDNWVPSTTQTLVAKRSAVGSNISFGFYLQSNKRLSLAHSTNGTTLVSTIGGAQANADLDVTAGEVKWVRATLDVDNGASGHEISYFSSDDGLTWTQIGTTRVFAGTTSIFDSTSNVEVGTQATGSSLPTAGKFYRAQILDGIDGTKVLDVDTSVITAGNQTTFNALTGQTVTIGRATSGRKSVAVVAPVWLFGTDDYMEVPDNALLNFGASDSFTALVIFRDWNVSAASSHLIAKKVSGALGAGWYVRRPLDQTVQLTIDDGTVQRSSNKPTVVNGNLIVAAAIRDSVAGILDMYANNTKPASITDTTSGTLANSQVLRIGRLSGAGTAYADMEFIAAAVFRRALTSGEITALTTYFQNRIGA
jgi:hypothetical protein